jgi:hypothetical protein
MPFSESFVENVSAGSSWIQTTEQDFNNGSLENVTVTPEGNVTLALQTKYVEDDFIDETKISFKENLLVDTSRSEARLVKNAFTFGWVGSDWGYSVKQTSDKGYITTGFGNNGYGYGLWLIKTNETCAEQWNKTFGERWGDCGWSVNQTLDSGYIIAGTTSSYGIGTPTSMNAWLIKTNSTGVEQWNRTFGGSDGDFARSVQQTSDSGYIIAGGTYSYGIGTSTYSNAWLIKTNSTGVEQWNRTFGGSKQDYAGSVQQTSDGGYIITGWTTNPSPTGGDIWLIKTDSSGNEQWNRTFGGNKGDYGYSGQQTTDGGYIITGRTDSYGAGFSDVWLIKTDSIGNEQWNKTFGWTSLDKGSSVQQTSDGGYIITGTANPPGLGWNELWLIKTDSSGNEEWNKTFGGNIADDFGVSVQQTTDGGYIIAGYTRSFGAGSEDLWLIKTNETGSVRYYNGNLTSTNLLAEQESNSIDNFTCDVSVVQGTNMKIQFSQDNASWVNATGTLNQWDTLSNGFNLIDLTALIYSGNIPSIFNRNIRIATL